MGLVASRNNLIEMQRVDTKGLGHYSVLLNLPKQGKDRDVLDTLDSLVDSHEACENGFFARSRMKGWSVDQLAAFGPEYQYFTASFPGILAGLISTVDDDDTRFFLTEILYSELGSGSPARSHHKLFRQLLVAIGLSGAQIDAGPRFEETTALVDGMRNLYKGSDVLKAMGAQYALERQAFPMIRNLYKGFAFDNGLVPGDLEFFGLHLVEEPKHLDCMRNCIGRYARTPEYLSRVRAGSIEFLELMAAFWRRLFAEVSALEAVGP
jgi:pyrroloquinoline quinone (PQQ) biosynthesis protein C